MVKVSKTLQQAIDSLIIQDVYLKGTQSGSQDDFDPKSTEGLADLILQQMHNVYRTELIQIENDGQLVRIYIRLGVRWVRPDDGNEPDVRSFVEADFIAEYKMSKPLAEEAVDEFAQKNASYHVWPYWREFLTSQCERLRLPRVVLPMIQFSKQAVDG